MKEKGEVHLVPCFSSTYCGDLSPFQTSGAAETDEEEKKKKLVEYQASMSTMEDGSESERSEAATPLLPVSVDDTGWKNMEPASNKKLLWLFSCCLLNFAARLSAQV